MNENNGVNRAKFYQNENRTSVWGAVFYWQFTIFLREA